MTPEYIVIHTAAFNGEDCDRDLIDQWHRARKWNGIGYHFVILNNKHSSKPDGTVEYGRPKNIQGAHIKGLNSRSVGICCVGHGDKSDFTSKQYESLYKLIKELMVEFSVPVEKVIGHREVNNLVDAGEVSTQYRTSKTCPGNKVDMNLIRQYLEETTASDEPSLAELQSAIATLENSQHYFHNANDELVEFLNHPEVLEIKVQ